MFVYRAYNLCLHSEIPLQELTTSAGHADVIINIKKCPIKPVSSNDSNHILGTLEGIAKVSIENGNKITVEPLPGVDRSRLSPSIVNGCMAVILRQRGYLVLHASSVEIDGEVAAFVGNSGAGKSTLAATFNSLGYRVLTDDVMAIKINRDSIKIIPGYPIIKLRSPSLSVLNYSIDCSKINSQSKFSHKLSDNFSTTLLPLGKIYVLGIGNNHKIIPLKPQQAFKEIVRNTRTMNVFNESSSLKEHLAQATSLISRVPISHFQRQSSLAEMTNLVNIILRDFHQTILPSNPLVS